MCGLFGFIPKKGRKANLLKLKILGIYNTERGTDSCGYYFAGNIEKGIAGDSDFKDFITNEIIRGDLAEDIFIGHTRRSTHGSNSYINAHPHLINERYVQTHNGVIENWADLCHKNDVPTGPIYVDSIGLGSIIEKNGFSILNEYKGKAALVMLFKDKPNSVFLFKGASKSTEYGKIEEERPLFVIQESEGIYYSSMKNSLETIKSSPEIEVKSLTPNNVWEVKNGDIDKTESIIKINREAMNVVKKQNHSKFLTSSAISSGETNQERTCSTKSFNFEDKRFKSNLRIQEDEKEGEKDCIYKEEFIKYDISYGRFKLQYCRGRYYDDKNMLLTGSYYIDSSGVALHDEIGINIIKRAKETKKQPDVRQFWFLNGVLLKGVNSFDTLKEFGCLKASPSEQTLSLHSVYPVIVDSRNAEYKKNTTWFKNGKLVSHKDRFSPIFSKNTYLIKGGKTTKITKGTSIKIVI